MHPPTPTWQSFISPLCTPHVPRVAPFTHPNPAFIPAPLLPAPHTQGGPTLIGGGGCYAFPPPPPGSPIPERPPRPPGPARRLQQAQLLPPPSSPHCPRPLSGLRGAPLGLPPHAPPHHQGSPVPRRRAPSCNSGHPTQNDRRRPGLARPSPHEAWLPPSGPSFSSALSPRPRRLQGRLGGTSLSPHRPTARR